MKVDERKYFSSGAWGNYARAAHDAPDDVITIKFNLRNQLERIHITDTGRPLQSWPSCQVCKVIREEDIRVSLSSLRLASMRREHTETITEIVSVIFNHIDEEAVRGIVDEFFKSVDSERTVSSKIFLVDGRNITLSVFCSRPLTVPVDTIRFWFCPPTPGFKSSPPEFLEWPPKLEEVKLDSFEAAGKSCPICIEDLEAGDFIRLPCSHLYHERCIDGWIKKPGSKQTCPMCRSPIFQIHSSRLDWYMSLLIVQ